jgi:hypothetical protein
MENFVGLFFFVSLKRNIVMLFMPFHASRAAQNLSNKEFKLFEQSEFLNSRQIRAAQGSSAIRNRVNGCLFFGSFLWASKERNRMQYKAWSNN